MTTATEGAELTRVGPGTVMGELMRQYWIPAAMSSELKADGRAGAADAAGREADRLSRQRGPGRRDGPSLPASLRVAVPGSQRGERAALRLSRLEVRRRGQLRRHAERAAAPGLQGQGEGQGLPGDRARRRGLGLYGRRAEAPPLPEIETLLRAGRRGRRLLRHARVQLLQALEGDIDTSHFGFLHAGHVDPDDVPEDHPIRHTVTIRAPEYHVSDTPWGTMYAAYRDAGAGQTYWRFANFLMPFWTQQPQGEFGEHVHARAWVPLDDNHTMFIYLWWHKGSASMARPRPPLRGGKAMGRPHHDLPAEHHRLARPLAARRRRSERLADRPRRAEQQRALHRDQQYPPAGPGGDGKHGRRSPTTPSSISARRTR